MIVVKNQIMVSDDYTATCRKTHSGCFKRVILVQAKRIYLTNRFHVAVHLSSNRSQMTSKCGKNKKVAHEAIAECVTDVLTTF